jgi:hypothetical protein
MSEWRRVPEFPNYEISDTGEIRALAYVDARGWRRKPRAIRGGIDGSGYRQVKLVNERGGRMRKVHRLLAAAWHGPCPEGMECRHLDGNRLHNTPDNLRWGTPRENGQDAIRHGTHTALNLLRGERGRFMEKSIPAAASAS